jgi:hypothetical protein
MDRQLNLHERHRRIVAVASVRWRSCTGSRRVQVDGLELFGGGAVEDDGGAGAGYQSGRIVGGSASPAAAMRGEGRGADQAVALELGSLGNSRGDVEQDQVQLDVVARRPAAKEPGNPETGPAVMDDQRRPGAHRGMDTCVLKEMSQGPPQWVGQPLQATPEVVAGLFGVQHENPSALRIGCVSAPMVPNRRCSSVLFPAPGIPASTTIEFGG